MLRSTLLGLAVAGVALAAPAAAQQSTIDFGDYASPATTEHQATIGNAVTSKGLEFTNSSFYYGGGARNALATWGNHASDPGYGNRPTNLGGATSLFVMALNQGIDIWAAGSDPVTDSWLPFDLFSMDVAHLYAADYFGLSSLPSFGLTVFGWAGGSVFSQDFNIAASGVPMLQTLVFNSSFQGVYNVWWKQSGSETTTHQFTNVVTTFQDPNVVPEPVSMVLLGTGLAGVGVARRRRSQSQKA